MDERALEERLAQLEARLSRIEDRLPAPAGQAPAPLPPPASPPPMPRPPELPLQVRPRSQGEEQEAYEEFDDRRYPLHARPLPKAGSANDFDAPATPRVQPPPLPPRQRVPLAKRFPLRQDARGTG